VKEFDEFNNKIVLKFKKIESAIKMFEAYQENTKIKGNEVQLFYDPFDDIDQQHFHYSSPRTRGRGGYKKREDERREEQQKDDIKVEDIPKFLKSTHKTTDSPKKEDPFAGIKPRDEFEHQKTKAEEEKKESEPQEETKDVKWKEYENAQEIQEEEQYYDYSSYNPRRGRGKWKSRYYGNTRGPGTKQYLYNEQYDYQNQVNIPYSINIKKEENYDKEEHYSPKKRDINRRQYVKKAQQPEEKKVEKKTNSQE